MSYDPAVYRKYYEKNAEKLRAASREHARDRRLKNPEYDAEVMRRYRERHPERVTESLKNYAESHRKEIANRAREWRINNPQKAKESRLRSAANNPKRNAETYARNKDRMVAAAAKWRRANPGKARDILNKSEHRRRARKAASAEHYTLAEIRVLRKKTGDKCAFCGTKGRMTIDHIKPLARGGSNGIRNIQFLCKPCNSKKQGRDPIDFAQTRGLLL